jgi:hypothetical protein
VAHPRRRRVEQHRQRAAEPLLPRKCAARLRRRVADRLHVRRRHSHRAGPAAPEESHPRVKNGANPKRHLAANKSKVAKPCASC